MRIFKIVSLFLILVLPSACGTETVNDKIAYDKDAFLINMADNLIRPAINDFSSKSENLTQAANLFQAETTLNNLKNLRVSVKEAWLVYQYLGYVHFGPLSQINFRDRVNSFPTDTAIIESNIRSVDYFLRTTDNVYAKGFPALDYLLFGTGETDEDVLDYISDANALQYLVDLSTDINEAASYLMENWSSYRETFVSNTGTDIGSGTSLLVNEYNRQFDLRLKNAKIGFPSGGNPRTGGITNPAGVEALYSAWSNELAIASVEASVNIFKGVSYASSEDGPGLEEYLIALGATDRNETPLEEAILDQKQIVLDQMNAISTPYSILASTEGGILVEVYNELQAVIPLIKVDMTSALSVSITFQADEDD